ncbi:membrane protein [Synergistales bacterium]|nr:membrane protein [Synergistales bacterium]
MKKVLLEKLKESLQAVLPIGSIILLLHFTIVPMPLGTVALMIFGMATLIIGLTLFSLGTEMAMMPMGAHIGSALLKSKSLALLMGGCFIFGFIVTVAEPDLQVMSTQVPSVPNFILLAGVAAGVGLFLVVAIMRVLFRLKLAHMLIVMYAFTFALAVFSSDYLAVAFDASAVTTGPITVPFLLALGAGVAGINGGKGSEEDNFGICAVCSVGPILAVLITGLFFDSSSSGFAVETSAAAESFGELLHIFSVGLEHAFLDVLMVIVPIVGMFGIFQLTHLKLSRTELVKIGVGIFYLVIGLTIFLTGVNEGFLPAGRFLGESMGKLTYNWVVIPISLVIGACVVVAEPAVHVLTRQVEEITNGAISKKMLLWGMAAGVGLALGLATTRMLLGISIWWILLPGYLLAVILTFFVPSIFVGIGFDSGGVAAGAMSAAFVLPFTLGVCESVGGNIMIDAFGVVGMISMMPPITIQIVGVLYNLKVRNAKRAQAKPVASIHEKLDELL